MSRLLRTISTFMVLMLLGSTLAVLPAANAQSTDPCAGIAAGKCITVDRADDPYPVDPDNATGGNDPTVLCTNNGLDCTLRAAIKMLNASSRAGTDPARIVFDIGPSGPGYANTMGIETWTIAVSQPLDALIRDNIDINGFSQEDTLPGPQNDFGPTIIIDGGNLTQPSRGLLIKSSNNFIRGLGINRFDVISSLAGVGIEITRNTTPGKLNDATGNRIQGCYIGVDAVGIASRANAYGIWVQTNNNIIGGSISTNGERNIISGNLLDGVLITSAFGNKVRGSYLGIARDGLYAIPNGSSATGGSGVALRDASTNTIGIEPDELFSTSFGNVISGNRTNGITIFVGSDNQILGNLIGTNKNGSGAIPNLKDGISISSDSATTSNNQVGSAVGRATRNIISGNGQAGIRLAGEFTSANRVQNNYIGLQKSGLYYLVATSPFTQTGIIIQNGSDNNLIGGTGVTTSDVAERNIISGNPGDGVRIDADISGGANPLSGASASGNQIIGNFIGGSIPNVSPTQFVLGNGGHGVFLNGFNAPIRDTTISGNTVVGTGRSPISPYALTANKHGIFVLNNNSQIDNVTVAGNIAGGFVGTIANPVTPGSGVAYGWPTSNSGDGIRFERNGTSKPMKTIVLGSEDYAQRNIASRNLGNGINIAGTGVTTTTMLKNTAQYNALDGVRVIDAVNVTLRGDATNPNLITNNGQNGVSFTTTTTTTVAFNSVGINAQNGIKLLSASGTLYDTHINDNQVYSNTLDGITQTGSAQRAELLRNAVHGNQGNGILWTGPSVELTVAGSDVYSNTLNPALGGSGISIGIVVKGAIDGNSSYTQPNGYGIKVVSLDQGSISSSPRIERNAAGGIRIETGLSKSSLTDNIVERNGGNGIYVANAISSTIDLNTVSRSVGTGIYLLAPSRSSLNSNLIEKSGGPGLYASGGSLLSLTVLASNENGGSGVVISDTQTVTLTASTINKNVGSGVLLDRSAADVGIDTTTILSNTVNGIQVGSGTLPAPQRVKIVNNSISGNGIPSGLGIPDVPVAAALLGRGIVFNPEGPPENAANPNHDINAPFRLTMSQSGQLRGSVALAGPQACLPLNTCTIQAFRTNRFRKDGQGLAKLGETLPDASGNFTTTLGTLPAQVTLTATDAAGNTSRFAVFEPKAALNIFAAQSIIAGPGEAITLTHTVSNTGNLDLTGLRLSATSSRGFSPIVLTPQTFDLAAGQQRTITVTLKLPTGSDPRVSAGPPNLPEQLKVTVSGQFTFFGESAPTAVSASVTNTITLQARSVLTVTPGNLNASAPPGTTIPYVHLIRNDGNIPTTFTITATTTLPGAPTFPVDGVWKTKVVPSGSLTLQPGEQRTVTVSVTVPVQGTGAISGTQALTTLKLRTTSPVTPSQDRDIVDTTTTSLTARATFQPSTDNQGRADQLLTVIHDVENLSNGKATFRLVAQSSLGSTVTFRAVGGTPLVNGDTFTLGTQSDTSSPRTLSIFADIRIARLALPGQTEVVTIYLYDTRNNIVGEAVVTDRITINQGIVAPRIWLPLIFS